MNYTFTAIKNLFLQQSYLDSWEDYARSLRKTSFIKWDYIILTASNEEQAASYRQQLHNLIRIFRDLWPTGLGTVAGPGALSVVCQVVPGV